jgi:GTPase SAR1 family protein
MFTNIHSLPQEDTQATMSANNQIYRNKHAFLVMCDISEEQSIDSVKQWLKEIEARASINDPVIMVLANKCELEIDQKSVFKLETSLQKRGVSYKEISVQLNIELKSSV